MSKIADWKNSFPDVDNMIHRDDFIWIALEVKYKAGILVWETWIELDCRHKTFRIVNNPC